VHLFFFFSLHFFRMQQPWSGDAGLVTWVKVSSHG
jgi:hypothetical protein